MNNLKWKKKIYISESHLMINDRISLLKGHLVNYFLQVLLLVSYVFIQYH